MRTALTTAASAAAAAVLLTPSPVEALRISENTRLAFAFDGAGCGTTSSQTIALPSRARGARFAKKPRAGAPVYDRNSDAIVARLYDYKLTRRGGRYRVTVTVQASDDVCTSPQEFTDGWESDGDLTVSLRYLRRVRVVFTGNPGQLQYRPRTLYFGAAGYLPVRRWSSWNGRVARGRGVFPFNDCNPYCAAGKVTRYPVSVRLSRPRLCNGRYRYSILSWRVIGPRVPAGGRSYRHSFAGYCP
ncbi:MAG TPA: hypothetical protein VEX39_06590 [Thermoleophilaceae bacterium]|nr:hypothetical protein [Thermoleophilaceae bacterium]